MAVFRKALIAGSITSVLGVTGAIVFRYSSLDVIFGSPMLLMWVVAMTIAFLLCYVIEKRNGDAARAVRSA